MERAATNKDCGSFFFVYRSSETRSHPASLQSPLTAKPIDNRGFPWMAVDIRLASGADGRPRWRTKDEECRRGDSARFDASHRPIRLYSSSFALQRGLCDARAQSSSECPNAWLGENSTIYPLARNPEIGTYRVMAAWEQIGIKLSQRTCGRLLELNRKLYGLETPKRSPHAKKEMPFRRMRIALDEVL